MGKYRGRARRPIVADQVHRKGRNRGGVRAAPNDENVFVELGLEGYRSQAAAGNLLGDSRSQYQGNAEARLHRLFDGFGATQLR